MSIDTFATLMAREEPAVAPMLLGLADLIGESFGDGRAERDAAQAELVGWVAARGAAIGDVSTLPPALQLTVLHEVVVSTLRIEMPWGTDPLLTGVRPERVAEIGVGHPVVAAALTIAVAEQAGVPLALLRDRKMLLVVHAEDPAAGAIEFGVGRLVEWAELDPTADLSWSCPHELAAMLLDLVAGRAERLGLRGVEVLARTLATRLPLHHEARERRTARLRRAEAAWN